VISTKELQLTIYGFLVASIVPAIIGSLLSPVNEEPSFIFTAAGFLVFYPFSAVFVFGLGVPTFLLLRPLRPGAWWSVAAIGFLLGIVVAVALRLPYLPNPEDFPGMGALGAFTALVFW